MKAPDHIMRDLSRKAGDDTAAIVSRVARLLMEPGDKMMIAISCAGHAIGAAAGYAELAAPGDKPEDYVDLMWAILRPIALHALGGDSADFDKLLDMCRRSDGEARA